MTAPDHAPYFIIHTSLLYSPFNLPEYDREQSPYRKRRTDIRRPARVTKSRKVGKPPYRNYRPPMNGERYLTDKEVSQMLKVSRRTLQEYRTVRTLPFIILGGKVLYREYDLQQQLEENYRKAIR